MKRIKSVIIVGGGSSGWMSAAYLSRVLFDLDITLVESPRTPTIGVGEATTPVISRFMTRLGFNRWESWLPEVDGTIKTGIRFENWYAKGDSYWHPFEGLDYLDEKHHVGHAWLNLHEMGDSQFQDLASFYRSFYTSTYLNLELGKGPACKPFAFHLDADRLATLLQKRSQQVRHILDDVNDVQLDEQGDIAGLSTASHGTLRADLYIDCTGFRRRIIGRVAESQMYETYAESLFCDRAFVLRFPYRDDSSRRAEMSPYVTASARSSGWKWTIPLFSRISSGYVYSSRFISDEQAEMELRNDWGNERTKDAVTHKVRFQSGKLESLWVRNCVAVGLAGGFIEPLESTGLVITQVGLEILASILDARYYDKRMQVRYNMQMQKLCDDIKQFIIAHYALTGRDDTPFWKAVKRETKIPDDLAARLEVFQRLLPTGSTKGIEEWWFFKDVSWFSVLLGMRFPFRIAPLSSSLIDQARAIADKRRRALEKNVANIPSHFDYLQRRIYDPWEQVRRVICARDDDHASDLCGTARMTSRRTF
jgi:tryptophan halogenase